MVRSTLLFALLFAAFTASCEAKCRRVVETGISEADKQIIVDMHNNIRKQIANGDLAGQPRGKGFKTMKYDEKLANPAQDISNTCRFEHVTVKDGRWSVGQNLFISMSTSPQKGANWREAVQAWINEYKDYTYGSSFNPKTGHYTQVVWANSEYVGCGYTFFKEGRWNKKLYTCNYGPAGNWVGEKPYQLV